LFSIQQQGMMREETLQKAQQLLTACRKRCHSIAVAESCTGGLLSAYLTAVPGSSDVFTCGFVTYSNAAKIAMLGVDAELIALHGAVSKQVAVAMAGGTLRHAKASLVAAVTGVAGPGGGSEQKPIGLVHIAAATRQGDFASSVLHLEQRYGFLPRDDVRERAVADALRLMAEATQGG
jgi:nicotinamide-nucleotide amidase